VNYRIRDIGSEQEAEAMVAADSFDAITERLQRMVCAGRGMVLAVREFTYTGRPPVLYGGLRLDDSAHGGGFRSGADDKQVFCHAVLTNGGDRYGDAQFFGFYTDIYQYSGNTTEAEAWKRFEEHEAENANFSRRRRDMTHVVFTGGLQGWRWQHSDRIVVTEWNSDGVATERTLGFEPGDGSWS
jgi:hypothetical protein